MSDSIPGISTVESGGIELTSNSDTPEQMRASLGVEKDSVSEAASELGKKGGQASAAKRAQEAQEATRTTKEGQDDGKGQEDQEIPQEGEEKPLGKPRDDPRARMLEATRKEAEAKRERDALRAERDALKAQIEAAKAPAKPTEQPVGKPQQKDFQSYDEWVEAVADWKAEEKIKIREAQVAQESRVREYTDGIDKVLGQAVAARKEYEKVDTTWFTKVGQEVKDIVNSPSIARDLHEPLRADHVIADEIILADEGNPSGAIGPRLMLHLTDHPEVLQRLREARTPTEVQVEMRILARSLKTTEAAPIQKAVSNAKPPLKAVTGSPQATEPDVYGDIDFDTFASRRMKARK